KHRLESSGANRYLCYRRNGIFVPVCGKGRRIGKQNIFVPGNESSFKSEKPRKISFGKNEDARHGCVPSISHGLCDWRNFCGELPQKCEACNNRLPGSPADFRKRIRSCIS